jgi:hypothetical protein
LEYHLKSRNSDTKIMRNGEGKSLSVCLKKRKNDNENIPLNDWDKLSGISETVNTRYGAYSGACGND